MNSIIELNGTDVEIADSFHLLRGVGIPFISMEFDYYTGGHYWTSSRVLVKDDAWLMGADESYPIFVRREDVDIAVLTSIARVVVLRH